MKFDLMGSLENPTFQFIFHETICILGSLYYLTPLVTRIREKRNNLKFTSRWDSSKNIVALYVALVEPIFLREYIQNDQIINMEVAVVTQAVAIIVIVASYLVLREKREPGSRPPRNFNHRK